MHFDKKTHVLIVQSLFYNDITDFMTERAKFFLEEKGVSANTLQVPGAFEIPAAIAITEENRIETPYDGYVAIGCVIRGETNHYDYVCTETSRGIMDLGVRKSLAIGFGILTVEDRDQAWVRAKERNKGKDAAEACLSIIALKKSFV